MTRIKYTKELLEDAVASSSSYAGVLRVLGLPQAGGTQAHVAKRIKEYGIDTSHFLGQAYRRGKISSNRKTSDQILVVLPEGSHRPKRSQLYRALLDHEIPEECASCGLGTWWNGSALNLEIDHIDGNWLNNLIDNLRFMCPNCHSQESTSNRSWKNKI